MLKTKKKIKEVYVPRGIAIILTEDFMREAALEIHTFENIKKQKESYV